jgi:hypothetical protein
VPEELGVVAKDVLRRVIGVVIAVGAGKDDDAEFHFLLCGGALRLRAIIMRSRYGEISP